MLTGLTKGGERGGMLIMAGKGGGGGVGEMLTMADKGGGGLWTPPPFLAAIICEQPLIVIVTSVT